MRDTFVNTLMQLAKENSKIELITGDLGFGVLKSYWEQLPNQFTNAGIAEQNMISVAAGMALEGKTVFIYSIGNFPSMRCLEQIRNDCAYHNANVKIVCVGGGFAYGSLGISHHATEDIAILRAIPKVAVFAPADASETEAVVRSIVEYQGTCYMRLGRGGEKRIHERLECFEIGKAIQICEGSKAVIFSTGAIFDEVDAARELLKVYGIEPAIYTFPTVKPIDRAVIEECARKYELIITCEEHNIIGGFGSAVAEVMSEMRVKKARLIRIGVNDKFTDIVGNQKYLRNQYGISAAKIAKRIEDEING